MENIKSTEKKTRGTKKKTNLRLSGQATLVFKNEPSFVIKNMDLLQMQGTLTTGSCANRFFRCYTGLKKKLSRDWMKKNTLTRKKRFFFPRDFEKFWWDPGRNLNRC
jgi:hypothetical protein